METMKPKKSIEQTVDLRGQPLPFTFGDDDSARAWLDEAEALRARLREGEIAVAPRVRISTRRGELESGTLVTVDEFEDERDRDGHVVVTATLQVHRLLRTGQLIAK